MTRISWSIRPRTQGTQSLGKYRTFSALFVQPALWLGISEVLGGFGFGFECFFDFVIFAILP